MNTKAIIAIAVAVVLVAGGAVAAIALMNGGDDKDDLPSMPQPDQTHYCGETRSTLSII